MYKLLIVDDEYEIHNGISKFFPWDSIGFTVVSHLDNGKKAYEYIQKNPVHIVLTDVNMPVMNGLELASLLCENYPDIYIVFFSGYSDFSFAQKALEYNVKSYILKSHKYNEMIRVFTKLKAELDKKYLSARQQDFQDNAINFNDKVLAKIKDYINDNFATVTLEDLTDIVHMNPNYISKFFKQKTGQNFYDYLIEIRMKKAVKLLDDINYKTYEVSSLVGYRNSENFSRMFKQYYGITPRDYRNGKALCEPPGFGLKDEGKNIET